MKFGQNRFHFLQLPPALNCHQRCCESKCNYFEEVAYPSDIEIGLSVSRLGSSAVTYHLGLFIAGAERTAATGTFIHVNVDAKTKRPCPIDDPIRAKFADLVVGAAIDPR